MNGPNWDLAEGLLGKSYRDVAQQAQQRRQQLVTTLLSQRRMPEEGWDELSVEHLLQELAMMDSNNFHGSVGVGEREGRLYGGASGLVSRRHFGMAHGVGRSGDISELQPKAAGSSLLSKLLQQMVKCLLRDLGLKSTRNALVLPLATGMALLMTFLALKETKPAASFVIWTRIDQKTCLKSILSAGLTPLIVENQLEGDQVRTNVQAIEALIEEKGADQILCIFSTTSTFAPRVPDRIVEIAQLAERHNVAHVINNAYGLQQSKCIHLIEEATRKGRVDCFIQSTDKNFLVPVGGSIIASSKSELVQAISASYPGRASASPLVDLFIQMLQMGKNGYFRLLEERKGHFEYFRMKLVPLAEEFGERVLDIELNPISIGNCTSCSPSAPPLTSTSDDFGYFWREPHFDWSHAFPASLFRRQVRFK
jgi:O-phospho-L-seryl-tRNASec:L-selenocysteinyl-tRNA synthase